MHQDEGKGTVSLSTIFFNFFTISERYMINPDHLMISERIIRYLHHCYY